MAPPRYPRSTFVTLLAWAAIAVGAWYCFMHGTLVVLTADAETAASLERSLQDPKLPPLSRLMMGHARLIQFASAMIAAGIVISGLGLLARRNWARILLIALLGVALAWRCVEFLVLMLGPGATRGLANPVFLFQGPWLVAYMLLGGWIVKRLLSPGIRREFAGAVGASSASERAPASSVPRATPLYSPAGARAGRWASLNVLIACSLLLNLAVGGMFVEFLGMFAYLVIPAVLAVVWWRKGLVPATLNPDRQTRYRTGHALLAITSTLAGASLAVPMILMAVTSKSELGHLMWLSLPALGIGMFVWPLGLWMVWTSGAPPQDPG